MSRDDEHAQGSDQPKDVRCRCPMCQMMHVVGKAKGPGGPFWDHLTNARIEVLRAVRSLIDERIDSLEKKKSDRHREKKATPIEVE